MTTLPNDNINLIFKEDDSGSDSGSPICRIYDESDKNYERLHASVYTILQNFDFNGSKFLDFQDATGVFARVILSEEKAVSILKFSTVAGTGPMTHGAEDFIRYGSSFPHPELPHLTSDQQKWIPG